MTLLNRLCLFRFSSPVHLGDEGNTGMDLAAVRTTLLADTLWSAIVHTWGLVHGQQAQTELVEAFCTSNPPWRHSDGLPFCEASLLLPKPARTFPSPSQTEQANNDETQEGSVLKKKFKKLAFIPPDSLEDFINNTLTLEKLEALIKQAKEIYEEETRAMVAKPRNDLTDAEPFMLGSIQFEEGAGLWVAFTNLQPEWEARLKKVLEVLGEEGIGGKRSLGYGRFTHTWINPEELPANPETPFQKSIREVFGKLTTSSSGSNPPDLYLQLGLTLPNPADITRLQTDTEAAYQLLQRRGYAYMPNNPDTPIKKRPITGITAGSLTTQAPLQGCMQNVTPEVSSEFSLPHELYRYGLGVNLSITLNKEKP